MNIFRLTGDLSHLAAIIILLLKIWKSRSCAGACGGGRPRREGGGTRAAAAEGSPSGAARCLREGTAGGKAAGGGVVGGLRLPEAPPQGPPVEAGRVLRGDRSPQRPHSVPRTRQRGAPPGGRRGGCPSSAASTAAFSSCINPRQRRLGRSRRAAPCPRRCRMNGAGGGRRARGSHARRWQRRSAGDVVMGAAGSQAAAPELSLPPFPLSCSALPAGWPRSLLPFVSLCSHPRYEPVRPPGRAAAFCSLGAAGWKGARPGRGRQPSSACSDVAPRKVGRGGPGARPPSGLGAGRSPAATEQRPGLRHG